MNRHRTPLVALLLCALAALGIAPATAHPGPAAGHPAGPPVVRTPDPDAPHTGIVTGAREPGRSPARERAVRAFEESRRSQREAQAGHLDISANITHNWWGVFPQPGTHDGIMATHTVDPGYRVTDAENFTYAPTTKAQNSCMEIVTSYWNSGDEIWAWDWCGSPGGPAKILAIDSDFLAKYTAGSGGPYAYTVQLVRDDAAANTWSGYLYNHRTAAWDLLYRQSGTDQSGLNHGWDMFEIYASPDPATGVGYYCTEARNTVFDSSAIRLRHGGAWKPASPSDSPWTETNPDGGAFLCPELKFIQAGADDHWTVRQ